MSPETIKHSFPKENAMQDSQELVESLSEQADELFGTLQAINFLLKEIEGRCERLPDFDELESSCRLIAGHLETAKRVWERLPDISEVTDYAETLSTATG
jgi:hypothetical protein